MENPIKMDDLGVPLFLETSKCFFGLRCFSLPENRTVRGLGGSFWWRCVGFPVGFAMLPRESLIFIFTINVGRLNDFYGKCR